VLLNGAVPENQPSLEPESLQQKSSLPSDPLQKLFGDVVRWILQQPWAFSIIYVRQLGDLETLESLYRQERLQTNWWKKSIAPLVIRCCGSVSRV